MHRSAWRLAYDGSSVALVLAAALTVTLAPSSKASAFVRSTVDGQEARYLFWRYRTVRLRPAYASSGDLDDATVAGVVARSVNTWNAAGAGCPSDFLFVDLGPPTGLSTNLSGGGHDGENRIVFREDTWPAGADPGTIALTTTVYRKSTGQILDADVDINGVDFVFTADADPMLTQTDMENTLTHELGHVLGLAHVPNPEATMFASSETGEVKKRSLDADDIAGLCWIYPDGLVTPGAPTSFAQPITSSCALSVAPVRPGPALGALSLLAVVLVIRRRRA
ncbi:MAG: matrixin family metalloprotease [Sandaracinaceae bacterium]